MKNLLILVVILGLGYIYYRPTTADFYAYDVDKSCKVVMFSAEWCGVCTTAKDYFDKKNYPYCERDIEKDSVASSYYQRLGSRGVPTILIGNKVSIGFYPHEIDEFIAALH